ncbi:minichromosome maintenance protein 5 [Polyrhizophydium stewartii]|uniref:DNA replication licensing factor MCM5 n=1 Tax=Polyrhizophydium stewartii TaxID=2732419 RepID=A0ABR4NJ41_9FUNG
MADLSGGWDAGRVTSTAVYPTEQRANSHVVVERRFLEFLRSFRIDNVFLYRDQLQKNLLLRERFIEVDMAHLLSCDEDLASNIKERPKEYLALFEKAAAELALQLNLIDAATVALPFQVMVISRSNPISIRELDTPLISKLVRVPGIIISAQNLQSKATMLHIMCRSCRHVKHLQINSGLAGVRLPRACDSTPDPTSNKPKCPIDPYVIVHDKSKFIDQQVLKLQELPGMVPVGELPRHLLMTVDRHLAGKVMPGMRVTATGIFTIFDQQAGSRKAGGGGGRGAAAVALRTPYLQVVALQVDPDGNNNAARTFTAEEEEEFLGMSRRPNLYAEFTSSIAPQIYGSEDIKKAIACLLFGGSKKMLPDGMRLRGDVNVLLLGDPGTAKSQMLKFVQKVAPIAVYTSGKGSSAAGLTASVIRDPSTRDFRLEAGAMVLADGGVVCIDEFDKMREEDRVAIHEAMEQQTISIAKAGITTILNSRTSVLAAANPVFGRYDDMKSPGDNIDFQTTILSRFDLIFIVRDEHDVERDREIARHVVNVHQNVRQADVREGEFDIQKMRSYISYCKNKCAPRMSAQAAEKLSSHFVEMRQKVRALDAGAGSAKSKTAIPITIRQLEAIIRITESLAKMTLSNVATERHVDEAIRLFNHSTMSAIQSSVEVEGMSRGELAEEVERVVDHIRRRFAVGSSMLERHLKQELTNQGFSASSVDKAIFRLTHKEVLVYEERREKVRRVRN